MTKPPECRNCSLEDLGFLFTLPEGTGQNGVIGIGEGPGKNEAIDGLPFRPHAEAGSVLHKAFAKLGYTRSQFRLYNLIQCQPPGNELAGTQYEASAITHCKRHFDPVVVGFQPSTPHKVILAFGNLPLKWLSSFSGDPKEKQSISYLRGYVLKSRYGLLVPTWHPSYIKRGAPEYFEALCYDIRKAVEVASGERTSYDSHPSFVAPRYVLNPSLDEARAFGNLVKDSSRRLLAYDIETATSHLLDEDEREIEATDIRLIQFSLAKGTAIAFPWEGEYKQIALEILAGPNPKAGHHVWRFDNPILRAHGARINGPVHDSMWMFKHWHPGLLRGLQAAASTVDFPFPWKHLAGSQLEYYGCADVDSIQWIMGTLPERMRRLGVWDCYINQYCRLERDVISVASVRGIPVSESAHKELQGALRTRLADVERIMQDLVPTELRNYQPKDGYKRLPIIVKDLWREHQMQKLQEPVDDYILRQARDKYSLVVKRFKLANGDEVQRWVRFKPFVPSDLQVKRYIAWQMGRTRGPRGGRSPYYIPVNKEGKETTRGDELKYLVNATGDELLGKVYEYRSLSVNLTNYLPNWFPEDDGRVHPTFNYSPPSGQLNSSRPNAQNVSKHTVIGQLFRRIIEAPKGHTFVEFDKRRFHVAMLGYLAEDPSYIRFAQLDSHSIFASHMVNDAVITMDMSDDEIRERVKYIKAKHKAVRNGPAKIVVLANQLGQSARSVYLANRKFFTDERDTQCKQDMLHDLFPKVEMWKRRITKQAQDVGYLCGKFGYIRWFSDVVGWKWNPQAHKWEPRRGSEYNEAISHLVQSESFGMIKAEILQCAQLGYTNSYGFVDTIHDSVIFLVELSKVERCLVDIPKVMNAPCKTLTNSACPNGLVVEVDASVGRNWQRYDPQINPEGMREL